MTTPIVWTIAGSDSAGGAGIQADLKTFQDFSVHGCSVITGLTAQNSQGVQAVQPTASKHFIAELQALQSDLPPCMVKLGMQCEKTFTDLENFFQKNPSALIFDPMQAPSYGKKFYFDTQAIRNFLPNVKLLTPNILEAEALVSCRIVDADTQRAAAESLLDYGVQAVYLKGGHSSAANFCHDYFTDGKQRFFLSAPRYKQAVHGTGCVFAAAVAAALAQNYGLAESVVIARMYVQQGIRLSKKLGKGAYFFTHAGFPAQQVDLPYLAPEPLIGPPQAFPTANLGIYPIVANSAAVQAVAERGFKTVQLRIKFGNPESEIAAAAKIAAHYRLRLFINDYWQLAIRHRVYGVHLGQEDLVHADLNLIRSAGLRLGISTHCFYEVARAHSINPSYLACGPIFATTSKVMPFAPQGLEKLRYWRHLLNYPIVAIGGIKLDHLATIFALGVEGVAMMSAVDRVLCETCTQIPIVYES